MVVGHGETLNLARQRSSFLRRFLIAALLLFGAVAASAWILSSILVHPANHTVQWPHGFERLRFEANPVSIPGSGHEIAGWWINSGSSSPAVILVHAVRADRATMVSRAQLLKNHGFSVLLIDLQAHGETPGQAITFGARESADVVAARAWLKRINPGRRIGVVGCSLGGAAVLLGPQPSGFDAVVLEAVYPRLTRAVENRIRIRAGPMAPFLAPLLLMQLEPRLHIAPSDLEPIKSIKRLGAPVLIAAGSDDEHTTLSESEELYAAAANPKELWVVKGAHHQDLLAYNAEEYEVHVIKFLISNLRSTPQFEPERCRSVRAGR
jgi:alpha-beta hydrolase superfamily lysophospholipase